LLDKKTEKIRTQNPLKENFEKLNARVCLPLQIHDELIGILFLGPKKSGEDYTREDLDILAALSRTEAIAISNAQLFTELSKMQNEMIQKEKMAVIGTLAAGINHEICNPLSIVRGECEIFLLNYRDNFYKDKSHAEMLAMFLEVMNKVVRETDRAAAITKRLSSFAKPSNRMVQETIWINKEIDELLTLIHHDVVLKNITVEKKFADNFPAIQGDKKQVDEALFNVLRNSVQHSDKPEGLIQVTGLVEDDFAVVTVEDNGSGMAADKIQNIFNPFYSGKESGKSTDLGLFITKQIMEQIKGSIMVESRLGEGTVFLLRFPITKP
jgi:two-component system sporulation sensor kinase B